MERIVSRIIESVFVTFEAENSSYFESCFVCFGDLAIKISVDELFDELIIKEYQEETLPSKSVIPIWADKLVGRTINRYWNCQNDMGYFDLLILSTDQLFPTVCIYGVASQLDVKFI